jgi:hypothetical protein
MAKKADNVQYCYHDVDNNVIILKNEMFLDDQDRYLCLGRGSLNKKIYDVIPLYNPFFELRTIKISIGEIQEHEFNETIDNNIISDVLDYYKITLEIYKNQRNVLYEAGTFNMTHISEYELTKLRRLIDSLEPAYVKLTKLFTLKTELYAKLKDYFENKFKIKIDDSEII